jgi:MSHA biogenesis protein MshO
VRGLEAGFTLIEIVVVLVITAILASLTTNLVSTPLIAYNDASARARIVERAEIALRRMSRDLQRALPQSVRVSGGALELLHVADGAAYRREFGLNPDTAIDHSAESDRLDFGDDASWNLLGRLADLTFGYGTALPAGTRAAVYPTSTAALYAQAAAGSSPGAITPAATSITVLDDGDEDQITLSAPFRFEFESPQQRFYLVDTPVSFLCDPVAGTLRRYASYAIVSSQPTDPTGAPLAGAGSSALLADGVESCRFVYTPGTPSRAALATLEIALRDGDERARLLHQVHVPNAP